MSYFAANHLFHAQHSLPNVSSMHSFQGERKRVVATNTQRAPSFGKSCALMAGVVTGDIPELPTRLVGHWLYLI